MKSATLLLLLSFVFACYCQVASNAAVSGYVGVGEVVYLPANQPGYGNQQNQAFTTASDGRVEVKFAGINPIKSIEFCATQGGYPAAYNLQENCPAGQYGKLVNDSASGSDIVSRKSFSAFNENRAAARFIGSTRFASVAEADDVSSVTLVLKPNSEYFFAFAHFGDDDENSPINLAVGPIAAPCPAGEVYSEAKAGCEKIPDPMPTVAVGTALSTSFPDLAKDSWTFYAFQPQITVGQRIFYYNLTIVSANKLSDVNVYMRAGGPPSSSQYADIDVSQDDDDTHAKSWSFNAPTMGAAETFWIGFENTDDDPIQFNLTINAYSCPANMAGINCKVNMLDAFPITNTSQINGKLSSASDMAYFKLMLNSTDLPAAAKAVRVSVANKDQAKKAPALYANYGYDNFPTTQYHSFNSSSQSGVSQMILFLANGVGNNKGEFVIGVSGVKGSFKIWAGLNCPSNCSDRGTCMCSGMECNVTSLYHYPEAKDSFGSCNCTKSKYDGSYDCSQTDLGESSTPFSTIYIILIAVGGAIVLAVAIGVPVYCYLQNRKRANYERV